MIYLSFNIPLIWLMFCQFVHDEYMNTMPLEGRIMWEGVETSSSMFTDPINESIWNHAKCAKTLKLIGQIFRATLNIERLGLGTRNE